MATISNVSLLKTQLIRLRILLPSIALWLATQQCSVEALRIDDNQFVIKVPIALWTENGVPVLPTENGYDPPRYLVGIVGIASDNQTEWLPQHFTFDLGNPGHTTFVVDECRGCSVNFDNGTENGCPSKVPQCNIGNGVGACWLSHQSEIWPLVSSHIHFPDFNDECTAYGDKVLDAGSLIIENRTIRHVCQMCFDNGNHSRFFTPRTANDVVILDPSMQKVVWPLPSPLQFGALLRTVPLQDRIWSNVGVGYHSSFLNQTNVQKLHFSLKLHPTQGSYGHIAFHTLRCDTKDDKIQQSYRVQHHRIHTLEGFRLSQNAPTGNETETKKGVMGDFYPLPLESNGLFEFIMDTGNGGICISSNNFGGIKDHVSLVTAGQWRKESNIMGGQEVLYVNTDHTLNSTLHVVFAGNINNQNNQDMKIVVSLEPGIWIQDFLTGKTIFMTCNLNVLGLPFMSSGLDLIFDDQHKKLELRGENVHFERFQKTTSDISEFDTTQRK